LYRRATYDNFSCNIYPKRIKKYMKIKRVKGHGLRSSLSLEGAGIGSWHLKIRPRAEAPELIDEAKRTKWLRDYLPVPARVAVVTLGIGVLATKTLQGQPSHRLVGALSPQSLLQALNCAIDTIKAVPTVSFPHSVPLGLSESFALRRIGRLDELTTRGKTLHPDFSDYTRAELRQIVRESDENSVAKVLVHGDLCMPNLLMDQAGGLQGVLDVCASHAGNPNMDASILSWSIAANMGATCAEYLLNSRGLTIEDRAVQRNRLIYDLSLSGIDRWAWIKSYKLEEQRQQITQDFQRSLQEGS
jgi:aminoglycoside phosphotransferase